MVDADEDQLLRQVGDASIVREGFDDLPIPVVIVDGADHRFVAANAAYRAFSGRQELIGMTMREAFPELDGQQLFEAVERVHATGETVIAKEWRVQFDTGAGSQEFFLDFTLLPRRADDGQVTGVLIQQMDVTERVQQRRSAEHAAAAAQQRYEAARDVVTELQEALLPTALPVLPGVTSAARYLVAVHDQAAGGDWFDAVALEDGRLALVVGDIVGHGVAASAAMGQLRAVLNELLRDTQDLDVSLARADRMAVRDRVLRGATVCAGILDPATGDLEYSTCGHPAPLIIGIDGTTRYLPLTGAAPIGTGAAPISEHAILAAGEVVLFYSDGLIERPGRPLSAGQEMLAQVAAAAAANRVMPTGAAQVAPHRVCEQSVELMTRSGYDDDVTVLAAQMRPVPIRPLHLEVPAQPQAVVTLRAAMNDWATDLGATPYDVDGINLAVAELVANTVEHAYSGHPHGTVQLDAALGSEGNLTMTVADGGRWQPPSTVPPATSGRGLWMCGKLLDDLDITHADAAPGTTVTIRHRLHHPALLASDPTSTTSINAAKDFSTELAEGPPRTLRVSGAVDITTAAEFADRIDTSSRGGLHPLVIDLSAVDVLASAGVKALFAARDEHAERGQPLTVLAAAGSVPAQVLTLVGLAHDEPRD